MRKPIIINNEKVRIDDATGFVNLTDMAKMKSQTNAKDLLQNWARAKSSVEFFYQWEVFKHPDFKSVEFDAFRNQAGANTFFVSVQDLAAAGSTGIFAKAGRYGGTFAHVDWAIHFANWMDPRFYVLTIHAFREMSDYFTGRDALYHRFSRELVAKDFNLITGGNKQRKIGSPPHPMTDSWEPGDRKTMVRRYMSQVDADILNLAVFGMTALDWRSRFPQSNPRKNMRDFATAEEQLVLNALQIELRVLQEDQYTPEEKLHRLRDKAEVLFGHYCDTQKKVDKLAATRKKRGW